jgi:4-hydroxyphenylacetate 3-monooxygenase
MSAPSTNGPPRKTQPLTRTRYVESLRGPREIWVHGERVADLTSHPVFRNNAHMFGRQYNALHDRARNTKLVTATDTGSDGLTHWFFRVPRSIDDLLAEREALAEWARIVYGWAGQSPEEGASLLVALGVAPEAFGKFESNARNWYRKASENVLFFHHAIQQPMNGLRDPCEVPLIIERETDAGLILTGSAIVPSCAALSHCGFLIHHAHWPSRAEDYPIAFIAPMDSPGVKLQCRPSSSTLTRLYGAPFDYPLTSRFEDNDSLLTFDSALVPWENVLAWGSGTDGILSFLRASFAARKNFQESIRLAVKLEFIAGLLMHAANAAGASGLPESRAATGELLSYRNLFWGLSEAQIRAPDPWINGALLPGSDHGLTYRILSTVVYPRVREIIERTVGTGSVFLTANAADFTVPGTQDSLDRLVRPQNGYSTLDRVKIMKLLWDAVGIEAQSRMDQQSRTKFTNELQELVYSSASATGFADQCIDFANRCLNEYDAEGWSAPDLITTIEPVPALSSRRRFQPL